MRKCRRQLLEIWTGGLSVERGYHDLPVINKEWLHRWRQIFEVSNRIVTVKYTVSLAKVLDRVGVELGNVFRLRQLWRLCHPGCEMRWVSMDQKPDYFNNCAQLPTYARKGAAQVGVVEDHHAGYSRYSILSFVQSWKPPGCGHPKMAILFKAHSGAVIRKKLIVPDWICYCCFALQPPWISRCSAIVLRRRPPASWRMLLLLLSAPLRFAAGSTFSLRFSSPLIRWLAQLTFVGWLAFLVVFLFDIALRSGVPLDVDTIPS